MNPYTVHAPQMCPKCTRPALKGSNVCYLHRKSTNNRFYTAWKRKQAKGDKK